MIPRDTLCAIFATIGLLLAQGAAAGAQQPAADTVVGRSLEAPVNTRPMREKFWWSEDWYERGRLDVPVNHDVLEREVAYANPTDGTEIPAILYRPKPAGSYPGVLFQHGRRGLDELVQRLARRVAARGFTVLAPNVYDARFLDRFPLGHDPITEGDVDAGIDFLLARPETSTRRICLFSHTRGGYYTLKVAVTFRRQESDVACYVSFYPHLQSPNAPEPDQVYRFAPEIGKLAIPALIFIGEYEQYQRRRSIETAVRDMKTAGRDVRLIVYPGVGRGFDFRPARVRTFADDLATKDSNMRAAAFMRRHLAPWPKKTAAGKN